MKAEPDEFLPTVCFGFQMVKGEQVLHQMYVTPMGLTQWRPVPMIELGPTREPCVAGTLSDADE